ncbi:MAG: chloride channel protein [Bacteroidetes bacterium]|nr:chloride channel protein [Bacteroidota bacterium]
MVRLWQFRNRNPRGFVYILCLLTGLIGGVSAVFLKNIVHLTGELVFSAFDEDIPNFVNLAIPGLGILLTVLFIKYVVKENISHGITKVLYAISRNSSKIKIHNTYSSVVSSTLTVGFGGSVGLEAPMVYTGAAIGSNIAGGFRMNYKYRTLLIGCGCAAAIAGIFKAPIAATIFALEVLMIDLNMWSIIPLLISSVTGASISYMMMGDTATLSFTLYEPFVKTKIPFYIALGVLCGLLSLYFSKSLRFYEKFFSKINNDYKRILIGGVVLGILIFLFPPLFGEGVTSLHYILGGVPEDVANNSLFYTFKDDKWLFLAFLVMVLLLKVVAGAATTGAGGIGGVFGPALFMGGITGFIFSRAINNTGWTFLSERNFSLVGMAGIMSGVMHAPLTSVFLIAEITGGYSLFVPLIITATASYLTKSYFDPHSVYTNKLAEEGSLITHHKDKALLRMLQISQLVEKDFVTITPDAPLKELIHHISRSKRNIFPVVDADQKFMGVILLDDIRDVMFKPEMYDKLEAKTFMTPVPYTLSLKETAESVINKFEITEAWSLPVVENGKFVGMLSKSKLLTVYRETLVNMSDE